MSQPPTPYHRAGLLLLSMLAIYSLLVATHQGAFSPFSIAPLASNAGRSWTRVLVRDISRDSVTVHRWETTTMKALPGRPVPLHRLGLSQHDLLVFVEHTDAWVDERRAAFHRFFAAHLPGGTRFMVYRVVGTLAPPDSVDIRAIPLGLLTSNGFHLRPTDAN